MKTIASGKIATFFASLGCEDCMDGGRGAMCANVFNGVRFGALLVLAAFLAISLGGAAFSSQAYAAPLNGLAVAGAEVSAAEAGQLHSLTVQVAKPQKVKITKLATTKTACNIKWKKVASNCVGFELKLVGPSKSWTYRTWDSNCTGIKIGNLTKGAKYRVKVRAVNEIGGSYAYGSWSAAKTFTPGKKAANSKKSSSKSSSGKVGFKEKTRFVEYNKKTHLKLPGAKAGKVTWKDVSQYKYLHLTKKGVIKPSSPSYVYKVKATYKGKSYTQKIRAVGFGGSEITGLTCDKQWGRYDAYPLQFFGVNPVEAKKIKWKVGNANVAKLKFDQITIDGKTSTDHSSCNVVAVGGGQTTVNATFKGHTYKVRVKVTEY